MHKKGERSCARLHHPFNQAPSREYAPHFSTTTAFNPLSLSLMNTMVNKRRSENEFSVQAGQPACIPPPPPFWKAFKALPFFSPAPRRSSISFNRMKTTPEGRISPGATAAMLCFALLLAYHYYPILSPSFALLLFFFSSATQQH